MILKITRQIQTKFSEHHTVALEIQDIRERYAFYKPHHLKFSRNHGSEMSESRALLFLAMLQPLPSPSPHPWSGKAIMPLHMRRPTPAIWQGRGSKLGPQ